MMYWEENAEKALEDLENRLNADEVFNLLRELDSDVFIEGYSRERAAIEKLTILGEDRIIKNWVLPRMKELEEAK